MTPEVQTGTAIDLRRGVSKLAEKFFRNVRGGSKAWDAGLGEVVNAAIHESELPGATSPVELARQLGILPKVRRLKK